MAGSSDIDRLIEDGLARYGAGDLDGALLAWEEALTIQPEHVLANSYVDYVRANYELLAETDEPVANDGGAPFAIEEEPEYQIEILPGEQVAPAVTARAGTHELDQGWDIEAEVQRAVTVQGIVVPAPRAVPEPAPAPAAARTASGRVSIELEAEEPPRAEPAQLAETAEVSFEDNTREYVGGAGRPPAGLVELLEPSNEFATKGDTETPGFEHESATPVGFAAQHTELKKRDLGFVRPAGEPPPPAELKITVRTPPSAEPVGLAQTIELSAVEAPPPVATWPGLGLEPRAASVGSDTLDEKLGHDAEIELAPSSLPPPSLAHLAAEPPEDIAVSTAKTRDLERDPTQAIPRAQPYQTRDPMVSAPTRELGLRPRAGTGGVDEEAPTREADVRAIREHAAARAMSEGTKKDVATPFDPMDAKSAQMLDDLDEETPDGEVAEDRTRRRVSTLFTKALAYQRAGELDKAVAAIELALSDDPNSALGQKLIHRNRETVMAVFQAFLGNLERQPVLARPLHELSSAQISPRAAFLLSRIDGQLTVDELLDVSGMPRIEAFRHLCQLYLRGILR